MEPITGKWIAEKLSGAHGEKARLADAMGISRDKFSKVLNGTRDVQSHETPLVLEFFGLKVAPTTEAYSLAEPSVKLLKSAPPAKTALIKSLDPRAKHGTLFEAARNYFGFGILSGDLLIVDIGARPKTGDLVIVTLNDPNTTTEATLLRRLVGDWLLCDEASTPPQLVDPKDASIGFLGTLRATARPAIA